jgi:hypothetical protein
MTPRITNFRTRFAPYAGLKKPPGSAGSGVVLPRGEMTVWVVVFVRAAPAVKPA